jgi:hypothetical protein
VNGHKEKYCAGSRKLKVLLNEIMQEQKRIENPFYWITTGGQGRGRPKVQ